jgi:hypothetical protein
MVMASAGRMMKLSTTNHIVPMDVAAALPVTAYGLMRHVAMVDARWSRV